jgi:sugar/nucleoside kinase (ribokinase family)
MPAAATRQQICASTSAKLAAAAPTLKKLPATIGLDGFVDSIIAVVDKRHDNVRYEPMKTIAALGTKIINAAGQSSNYEMVVKQTKLGGNGPIMANALAAMGMDVSYIGNLGYPTLHPVFQELANRAHVISIAEPGTTDALEFDDGKLMFGKHESLKDINWDNLVQRVGGLDKLKSLFSQSRLVGMVNWTMLAFMTDIWRHLLSEVLPSVQKGHHAFFVDLADPEKRTHNDIHGALDLLTRFQEKVDVILGLNLKEAGEVGDVLGLPGRADPEASIKESATEIRRKLGISCVVVHPRRGAAAATETHAAEFAGPFVAQPKISTGAGDHFNAGFCLGRVLGFDLEESLCTGVATSGYYVRTAVSPSATQLAEFIGELPAPE